MKEMTIENSAGPEKHQAVALRIGADRAVVYHCSIIGYQDTLYVPLPAPVLPRMRRLRHRGLHLRQCGGGDPKMQYLGAEADGEPEEHHYGAEPQDPNQNTRGFLSTIAGFKLQATSRQCRGSIQTFLGRPWKMYSRGGVHAFSYMGDLIDPAGWLEWNGNFALDTLYYGAST
ncbi:hypothetical protein HPP92_028648 [Vanilla planifolia]|uniref:Pectinesterase catalytic domain-containing protein n=1 Tax=Vanilla planifolia TaxID=51239 RepID=A0A835P4K9_VANPL|nr:hypothetical protein HPP92_028648 [Vanilla planifolia]KAG0446875.1 hypothetical protein HPP92_028642 [Vanilla planifolia]